MGHPVPGGPAFDLAETTTKWAPHSSRFLRRVGTMLPAVPIPDRAEISSDKQHRTRPCKERKDGAPTAS